MDLLLANMTSRFVFYLHTTISHQAWTQSSCASSALTACACCASTTGSWCRDAPSTPPSTRSRTTPSRSSSTSSAASSSAASGAEPSPSRTTPPTPPLWPRANESSRDPPSRVSDGSWLRMGSRRRIYLTRVPHC